MSRLTLPVGIFSVLLLAGCGADSPTEIAAPESSSFTHTGSDYGCEHLDKDDLGKYWEHVDVTSGRQKIVDDNDNGKVCEGTILIGRSGMEYTDYEDDKLQ